MGDVRVLSVIAMKVAKAARFGSTQRTLNLGLSAVF